MWHTFWKRGMDTEFSFGNLKLRDHSEDLNVNGKITLKFILKKQGLRAWN
jgi:hypothetical protein